MGFFYDCSLKRFTIDMKNQLENNINRTLLPIKEFSAVNVYKIAAYSIPMDGGLHNAKMDLSWKIATIIPGSSGVNDISFAGPILKADIFSAIQIGYGGRWCVMFPTNDVNGVLTGYLRCNADDKTITK